MMDNNKNILFDDYRVVLYMLYDYLFNYWRSTRLFVTRMGFDNTTVSIVNHLSNFFFSFAMFIDI
jgi:hypothetical protein